MSFLLCNTVVTDVCGGQAWLQAIQRDKASFLHNHTLLILRVVLLQNSENKSSA